VQDRQDLLDLAYMLRVEAPSVVILEKLSQTLVPEILNHDRQTRE
jgi:hypothetical protein